MNTTLQTKTYKNNGKRIETAETNTLKWDNNIEPNSLWHKPSSRYIYQSEWINERGKMCGLIDDATAANVSAFWAALEAAKQNLVNPVVIEITAEESDWYHINEFGERELNEDY